MHTDRSRPSKKTHTTEQLLKLPELSEEQRALLRRLAKNFQDNQDDFERFMSERHAAAQSIQEVNPVDTPAADTPVSRDSALVQSFDQRRIVDGVHGDAHHTLFKIKNQFGGLCEVISNFVIEQDLLGKQGELPDLKSAAQQVQPNPLKLKVNIQGLNREEIRHSHILKTTNIFSKLLAIIFEIYPHSIIPAFSDILIKDNNAKFSINTSVLGPQLEEVAVGSYIKFMVFRRNGFSFKGHSMVIKKMGDNSYSFFDPDKGEYQNLDIEALTKKMNKVISSYQGSRVALINGDEYIKELGLKDVVAAPEHGYISKAVYDYTALK